MLIATTTLPAEWQKTQRCGTEGLIIISHRAHDNRHARTRAHIADRERRDRLNGRLSF